MFLWNFKLMVHRIFGSEEMGMIALKDLKLSIFTKYVNKIGFFFNSGIKSRNLFSIFKYLSKVKIDLINIIYFL